jgi:hypothetical protein
MSRSIRAALLILLELDGEQTPRFPIRHAETTLKVVFTDDKP